MHSAQLVGEQLRYAVIWKGQWLAVATWSAAALHLKARDQFIGWTEEQRRQRLPLVVNNSRLYVLAPCHYPNLVSRFMKLMLARLSADWQTPGVTRWRWPRALWTPSSIGHRLQGQWLETVGAHARLEAQRGGFL